MKTDQQKKHCLRTETGLTVVFRHKPGQVVVSDVMLNAYFWRLEHIRRVNLLTTVLYIDSSFSQQDTFDSNKLGFCVNMAHNFRRIQTYFVYNSKYM